MSSAAPTPFDVFGLSTNGSHRSALRLATTGLDQDPTRPRPLEAPEALGAYRRGDVVAGRLTDVGPDQIVAELFPGLEVTIDAEFMHLAHGSGDLRSWWVEGEILTFFVLSKSGISDDWRLAWTGPEHREVVPAPPLREGGAPWINAPANPTTTAPTRVLSAVTKIRSPGTADDSTGNSKTAPPNVIDKLTSELRAARRDNDILRTQLRSVRVDNGAALSALATQEADLARFDNADAQLRFEVELAWARRTTPAEKFEHPMREWRTGPDFVDTLDQIAGVARHKVIDVIVDVITGRAASSAGRAMHRLRTAGGAACPPRTRQDGAVCWRIALQKNTPAARRLHFWITPHGDIELAAIRLHDDTRS